MSAYDDMTSSPKRAARRMCAEAFGVEEHRLVGARRLDHLVTARQATYLVLRERFPELSLTSIGKLMGGRDHTTIIHGLRAIRNKMTRDPVLRQVVASLIKGTLPLQHDAHVRRWQVAASLEARRAQLSAVAAEQSVPDDDEDTPAECDEPLRVFCEQCDQRLTIEAAARCQARICGLRGRSASGSAAVGHQGSASSSAAVGQTKTASKAAA